MVLMGVREQVEIDSHEVACRHGRRRLPIHVEAAFHRCLSTRVAEVGIDRHDLSGRAFEDEAHLAEPPDGQRTSGHLEPLQFFHGECVHGDVLLDEGFQSKS